MMRSKFYVTVIRPCEDGRYYLFFPDFKGCSVLENNFDDCIKRAGKELDLYIDLYRKISHREPPPPTDYTILRERYPHDMLQFVPVGSSVSAVRNNRAVKKTLSIPAWLDEIGKKHSLPLSKILKEAMIEKLKAMKDLTDEERNDLIEA